MVKQKMKTEMGKKLFRAVSKEMNRYRARMYSIAIEIKSIEKKDVDLERNMYQMSLIEEFEELQELFKQQQRYIDTMNAIESMLGE